MAAAYSLLTRAMFWRSAGGRKRDRCARASVFKTILWVSCMSSYKK